MWYGLHTGGVQMVDSQLAMSVHHSTADRNHVQARRQRTDLAADHEECQLGTGTPEP